MRWRARLTMPGGKGVPKVMQAEVFDPSALQGRPPSFGGYIAHSHSSRALRKIERIGLKQRLNNLTVFPKAVGRTVHGLEITKVQGT